MITCVRNDTCCGTCCYWDGDVSVNGDVVDVYSNRGICQNEEAYRYRENTAPGEHNCSGWKAR